MISFSVTLYSLGHSSEKSYSHEPLNPDREDKLTGRERRGTGEEGDRR